MAPSDQASIQKTDEITPEELALLHEAFFSRRNISGLVDQLPFSLWIKDIQGRFVGVNQQWLDEENFDSVGDVTGKNAYDLFDPIRAALNIRRDWEMLDEGRQLVAVDQIERDGKELQLRTTRLPLRNETGAVVGVIGFSKAGAAQNNSIAQATPVEIDSVTGAGTRAALDDRLTKLIGSDQPATLLLFSLDDHGIVSDSLGNEFGDMLLGAAARRFTTAFGPHLFRNRPDEFAVVLPTIDSGQLKEVGQTMLDKWNQPLLIDGNEIYGSISVGMASLANRNRSPLVIQDSELAVNKAKREGGNRVVMFSPELRQAANDDLAEQMLVRRAVANKEFNLHWQPIVDIESGQIHGCEALLRWRPAGGSQILPAAEFFPFLERSGLIVQLGKYVIDEACRQHVAWREHNAIKMPIPVFVNVSVRQFIGGMLANDVLTSLHKHGMSPEFMTIELAESSLSNQSDEMVQDLKTLRDAGVHIAIDDFGASQSSIASLSTMSIDFAKVDRRLTNRIINGADEPILDALVAIFQSQNIRAVAQGVENEGQLAWLRDRGWGMAQGYHLGEPLDAYELIPKLARRANG